MALSDELVARIEKAVAKYGAGLPVSAPEVLERSSAISVVIDADYRDFVGRWGGCYVGVPVHAWHNSSLLGTETCVQLTMAAREGFGSIIDGLVIADDGAGNPIWIAADGAVKLADHNDGHAIVHLADSFAVF